MKKIESFPRAAREKVLEKTWYAVSPLTMYASGYAQNFIGILANYFIDFDLERGLLPGFLLKSTAIGGAVENLLTEKRVKLKGHVDVSVTKFRGFGTKHLSDGSVIRPGNKVGGISFSRNIPTMKEEENLFTFTKRLFRSSQRSYKELARLCQRRDKRLKGVNFFGGVSHIAGPLAKRAGFDIFEIKDPFVRILSVGKKGKAIVKNVAGENKYWREFKENYKEPRLAIISRRKLIRLYGVKARKK